jgi:hypothetical protein
MSKKCGDNPPKNKDKKFSCRKCGAVSNKKTALCKPDKHV